MTSTEPAKAEAKVSVKPAVSKPQPVAAGQSETAPVDRHRTRIARAKSYPPVTLQSVLAIADAIRGESRTNELGLVPLANAVNRSPGASQFRVLVTGSADYGLTRGSYKSATITLTDRGMAYARPRDDSERQEALVQAAMAPRLFAQLYGAIAPNKWPADGNVENILIRDHKVPAEFAKEAATIAKTNASFVGLLVPTKTGAWLTLKPDLQRRAADAGLEEPDERDRDTEETEHEDEGSPAVGERLKGKATDEPSPARPMTVGDADRVFLSHSKNPAILEQIKTILEFGRFVAVVAEEEETTAIPVPEKVLASMRRCGSAVINVSADGPERRDDGSYGINQNVLIEIGAAFALYDRRVVLVVDKRVQLPSNLQGLYRSEYEGDELGWTAGMKLQKALTNFRDR